MQSYRFPKKQVAKVETRVCPRDPKTMACSTVLKATIQGLFLRSFYSVAPARIASNKR